MSYIPRMKYVFVQTQDYAMEYHLPLLRYLNRLGMAPRILTGSTDVIKTLMDNNIYFDKLQGLPQDYDIMISLAPAFLPLGRYFLEKSARAGRINVFVAFLPMPFRYQSENTTAKATKFFHAMCFSDQRSIDNTKHHNNEVLCLNTGHPVFDEFSTKQFRKEVTDIKRRFGERLLVVTVDRKDKEDLLHCRRAINCGESAGFRVILQAHEVVKNSVPNEFKHYVNPGLNRHALFASASHVIASIISAVVPECLYLGTKVSCKLFGIKDGIWANWFWFDNPEQWYHDMLPFYGKEYLDMIPLIHGESSMKNFLSSDEKSYTKEDVDRIFGWPKVDNFTENVFRTIETHFGEQRNVQAALVKSRAWRSTVDHFCWNCEIPNSPIKYISDPNTLLRSGINALNQGDIGAAVNFLKFAEKFSNFEKFELIQFALATCFHAANKHEEAKNHIYKALAINPDCAEYQNFNNRIKAAEL